MDQIEEIKEKIDIVDLISDYLELKKAGRNFKALCPFHTEKTPSFMVSPELQIFKCFGCGIGGDIFKFLQEYEKIDFPEALKILAERAGVKLRPFKGFATFAQKEQIYTINREAANLYHYLLLNHQSASEARKYLKHRGISRETIVEFKIGFAPQRQNILTAYLTRKKGYDIELVKRAGLAGGSGGRIYDWFRERIVFPIEDHFGNILGFSGRLLAEKKGVGKYINTPETLVYKKGKTLYGLAHTKQAIKKEGFAIAVEGEFDLLSSWQAGICNVVAIKGSSFTQDQASILSRFCSLVYLALDSDFAGDQAAQRGISILQEEGIDVKIVNLGGFKDPDELIRQEPDRWKRSIQEAEGVYDFLIKSVLKRFDITTTQGKAGASRLLSPILASIQDEIVKAACIKQVAEALGVPEESVAAQAAKVRVPDNSSQTSTAITEGKKGRREILEDYLLQLVLAYQPDKIYEATFVQVFQTPLAVMFIEKARAWHKENPNSNLRSAKFLQELPPELKDYASTVFLAQLDKEKAAGEIERTLRLIKTLNIKEQITKISQQIQEAERKRNRKQITKLEKELARLSKQLSELESS